ncbi:hypothetical protein KYC5002_23620 [Archangium violaceum]|uniref:hypothetical protein n=1 Tax=Archangium violaceum TaxID=83451 RepID=UPI002B300098|nr:hypothetical protein KYC5002_23620 [Archangium gephyra]
MSASPFLAVTATDESSTPLLVNDVKLKPSPAKSTPVGPEKTPHLALSGLGPGKYELCISVAGHPELVFPLSLVKEGTELVPKYTGSAPLCCPAITSSSETSGGSTKQLHTLAFTLTKTHSEVILVAGWDYSGGTNNVAYCETYRDDLFSGTTYRTGVRQSIPKRIDNSTVVTIFDFKTGNRSRMVKSASGWMEMDRVLQGTVKTHLGSYKDATNVQKRYLDDSISIQHVYDYIITLGAAAPGSLREFHIFSHAWAGGPILIETYEGSAYAAGGAQQTRRDPNDKDPRIKDFELVNMPRLKDFKAAFAADAIAKIWGCMATTAYRNLLRATAKAKSDSETISVEWNKTTKKMTAGDAKKYFRDSILEYNYMAKLSTAVGGGLKVYGAPPGMGADLRAVPVGSKKHNHMYINKLTYALEYTALSKLFGLVPDDTGYILF